jgi:hypothetical protein
MQHTLIPEVPSYTIDDEILSIAWGDHTCYMSLRIAKLANASLGRVIAEYEAKNSEPIPIGRTARG